MNAVPALLLRDMSPEELTALISDAVETAMAKPRPNLPPPLLVDRAEMARLISISTTQLDKMVRDGVVPSTKSGSKRLFSPAKVVAAMEAADTSSLVGSETE